MFGIVTLSLGDNLKKILTLTTYNGLYVHAEAPMFDIL